MVICSTEEEIKISLYISGHEIKKVREAVYLGLSLTVYGLSGRKNIEVSKDILKKAHLIIGATSVNMSSTHGRANYIMETYFRSSYLYNAVLIGDHQVLEETDNEIYRRLFRTILKTKNIGITNNGTKRLQALFHITPLP